MNIERIIYFCTESQTLFLKVKQEEKNLMSIDVYTSKTNIAAPSPITNPSRSLSNGLEALRGSSLKFRDNALALKGNYEINETEY